VLSRGLELRGDCLGVGLGDGFEAEPGAERGDGASAAEGLTLPVELPLEGLPGDLVGLDSLGLEAAGLDPVGLDPAGENAASSASGRIGVPWGTPERPVDGY